MSKQDGLTSREWGVLLVVIVTAVMLTALIVFLSLYFKSGLTWLI